MDKLDHTLGVHAGREDLRELGVHALPLDMSTTYPVTSLEQGTQSLDDLVAGKAEADNPVYARLFNPGVARYEKALARAENAEAAVAFSSGMAALTAAILATRERGNHIVAVRPIYGTTDHLLSSRLLGNDISWVKPDEIADAVRADTAFVLLETPTNPTLEMIDITHVVAQAGNVPVIVDSTFATPVLQRPIEHGAAMVMHSATKFLGGHGDVIAGIMACSEAWAARLRQVRVATGALLHPWAAYLLHRSLPTLKLRIERAQSVADELARRLQQDSRIERVYYPGLEGEDKRGLLGKQMDGPGCVLSFDVAGGYQAAAAVISNVSLMTPAVSLGSVDTLIQHPAGLTHRVVDETDRTNSGIREGLLRLSVGLEEVDDLWADLDQALAEGAGCHSRAA